MSTHETNVADGRRARRDRNRSAVIDAMFELLEEGRPPSTEQIADRAGVSVSSVFRYFESLDDLQQQTIDVHFERFGALFDIPSIGVGTLEERISGLVDARIALHGAVAPIARLARARAIDQPLLADQLGEVRRMFSTQIREHFATDLDRLTPAVRSDTVDAVDVLTAFEAWDLLTSSQGRSERQIRRAWTSSIRRLLAADV